MRPWGFSRDFLACWSLNHFIWWPETKKFPSEFRTECSTYTKASLMPTPLSSSEFTASQRTSPEDLPTPSWERRARAPRSVPPHPRYYKRAILLYSLSENIIRSRFPFRCSWLVTRPYSQSPIKETIFCRSRVAHYNIIILHIQVIPRSWTRDWHYIIIRKFVNSFEIEGKKHFLGFYGVFLEYLGDFVITTAMLERNCSHFSPNIIL